MLSSEQIARLSSVEKWCFVPSTGPSSIGIGLSDKVRKNHCVESVCSMKISEILDTNLDMGEFRLTKFQRSCELTHKIVYVSVLGMFARFPLSRRSQLHNECAVALNTLAWMVYHGVSPILYHEAVEFKNKADNRNTCVICNARKNVESKKIWWQVYMKTTGPGLLTGGRKGHFHDEKTNTGHFVLWTKEHCASFSSDEWSQLIDEYGKNVFIHGEHQYGHAHVHILLGKDIYDTRAKEMLKTFQKAINWGYLFKLTDLFHPVDLFLAGCSAVGRSYMFALFCAACCLHSLDVDEEIIVMYYQSIFPALYVQIALTFEYHVVI